MVAETTNAGGPRLRGMVHSYYERKGAHGLRPVQIWVPDTCTAHFRTEAHRQSAAVAASAQAAGDQAFVDSVADLPGR